MIHELTAEQRAKMLKYVDKWIKIGLSTEPTNKERALKNVVEYYKAGKLDAPRTVIFADSPLSAMIIVNLLKDSEFCKLCAELVSPAKIKKIELVSVYSAVHSAVHSAVGSEVGSAVGSAIDSEVRSAVDSAVDSAAYSEVRSEVYSAVYSAVVAAVHLAVDSAVRSAVDSAVYLKLSKFLKNRKLSFIHNYTGGNLWCGWQASYDFFKTELGVKGLEIIEPTLALSQDVGWIFPYKNLCVLTKKPVEINRNDQGQLHHESKKAIQWADGWGFYSLNGTRMPTWIFETPKDQIDPKEILAIKNVDIRTRAIEWFGRENLLDLLGYEVIDEKIESNSYKTYKYQLIKLDVGLGKKDNYLYMENPSCDEKHVEPVSNECKTVDEALEFRIPKRQKQKYGYKPPIARA